MSAPIEPRELTVVLSERIAQLERRMRAANRRIYRLRRSRDLWRLRALRHR